MTPLLFEVKYIGSCGCDSITLQNELGLISFNDIAIEENKDEMDINKITDLMISFNKKKKTKKNKQKIN